MKITFGAIVADARGSISGNTFSRNASGSYVRRKVAPTNSASTAQQAVRQIFGSVAQAWRGLTEAQRDSWIQGASQYPQTDALGNQVTLTAAQLFSKFNNSLAQVGLPRIETLVPPYQSLAPFTLAADFIVPEDPAEPIESQIWRDGEPEMAVPGNLILLEATRPMSAGIYRPKRADFRQIGIIPAGGAAVPRIEAAPMYASVFGRPPGGAKISYRLTYVDVLTGQRTTPYVITVITQS